MSWIYNYEFIDLNMHYINKVNENDIVQLLRDRTNNLEHNNFSMDYERLITITAIDHFVCKRMLSNEPIGNKTKIYFKALDEELIRQPLLYLSLPIRSIEINVLKRYLPNIERVRNICFQKERQAQIINKKIKEGQVVSASEINTLIKYFDYVVSKDASADILKAQDNLAKYLLNNEKTLDLHALSFLVKYFGYKKCKKLRIENIEILIGDLSSYGNDTYGLSFNKSIVLSKDFFVETSFLGNTLKSEFSKNNNGKLEGLVCLNVLFHELRHALQDTEHFEKNKSDISFAMSTRKILQANDKDEYGRNYELYNIESDANQYGWLWTREIIKDYMNMEDKDRLAFYAEIYAFKHMIKKVFSAKLGVNKQARFIGCFEKEELDVYFKKNPSSLIDKYAHFRVFYNIDGTPKGLNELIRLKSSSSVDFRTFYGNQISARIVAGDRLDYPVIDTLSTEEKVNILKNFNNVIHNIERKFTILGLRMPNGSFMFDDLSERSKRPIIYNVSKYFQLVNMYVNIVNDFIARYPEVLQYDVINDINVSLKSINENKMIGSLLPEKQIELIGDLGVKRGIQNGRK